MSSSRSRPYHRRLVDERLDRLLRDFPAVLVIGPRASGKTTTMGRRAATMARLDDPAEAAVFSADSDGALRRLREPILIDEWQEVPDVLRAVRRSVDDDWHPNRFYVTGSVRGSWNRGVWPATGRIIRVAMYPMTVREQLDRTDGTLFVEKLLSGVELENPVDPPDLLGYVEHALRGGFPTVALHPSAQPDDAWLSSYVDGLLTHDVLQIDEAASGRRDARRLRGYFEALALNSAGVSEHKTLYDAAGISKQTAVSYDQLLSDLLVVETVPAWFSNRLKRLVHQPKRYLIDAALMCAVLGVGLDGVMRDGALLGRVVDTFVVSQLRPELAVMRGRARLHHLRTAQGRHEVDLVVEVDGGRLIGIEIKATSAPRRSDARHLAWLRDQLGEQFVAGVVFHTGPYVFKLDERITAVPIATLWS